MSISGLSFIFWRIMEIITLIPTLGMLAYFVDFYNTRGALTPQSVLVLFIVSVLGAVWAIGTLFLYSRARHSAGFVAFIDILFFGAFIGAVWCLRGIANADCTHWNTNYTYNVNLGLFTAAGTVLGVDIDKTCAMLKACFAFGIMNVIFFFLTAIFSLLVHHHYGDRVVVKRETHYSRHGHRSSHRSRSPRHSHATQSRRSYA
ncbi:hypothetical protein P280DRAFT_242173 [Massarina eburnea CBS 473.64]|uniref:MARVEL domain-containing protein n=1 Tax=Massarina eburnea CBS 473.64 TaxID=1395130 RepID=A0A6A6S5L0_9PLEO|nr:hypothetical protein P280DRAFT_242173 [Massarina eburnea CBS 473.64]